MGVWESPLEGVVMLSPPAFDQWGGVYAGARVLVTGHTGFKGAWLCEWLLKLGAHVTGYALAPDTSPSLFEQLGLEHRLRHLVGDVRDRGSILKVVEETAPRFVFHLAAQPLVRRSYREPAYTWETNVLGTCNVLDSLRGLAGLCAAVMVTSDKCYENREWVHGYRECDPLGGHDPYSSSKAAAEIAVASWRRSFFGGGSHVRVASARAGNVIGGGDWSEDRIVPDCVRALIEGQPINVRSPAATRPWQHVLEPTSAYLALGATLATDPRDERLEDAFNVGPGSESNRPVEHLVGEVLKAWPGTWVDVGDGQQPHEAALLHLDTARIRAVLGWKPSWPFEDAVARTIAWYRDVNRSPGGNAAAECTARDISDYCRAMAAGSFRRAEVAQARTS